MAWPLLHFILLVYRDPNMRAHDLLPQRHASTGCHYGDTLPQPRVIYSCCSFSFNGWLHCICFHKGSRDLYWSLAGTECHRVSLLVSPFPVHTSSNNLFLFMVMYVRHILVSSTSEGNYCGTKAKVFEAYFCLLPESRIENEIRKWNRTRSENDA